AIGTAFVLLFLHNFYSFFFFFQAEDGIRDRNVTGVQTCALPIYTSYPLKLIPDLRDRMYWKRSYALPELIYPVIYKNLIHLLIRSEERRVGKECSTRWSKQHKRKKRYRRRVSTINIKPRTTSKRQ